MVLCKALVEKEDELGDAIYDEKLGWQLPELPLHIAREIMTRADYIHRYDVSYRRSQLLGLEELDVLISL